MMRFFIYPWHKDFVKSIRYFVNNQYIFMNAFGYRGEQLCKAGFINPSSDEAFPASNYGEAVDEGKI